MREQDSYEAKLRMISDEVSRVFGGDVAPVYVVATFGDVVVFRDYEGDRIYRVPYEVVDDAVVLGQREEVSVRYVLKRLAADNPGWTAKEVAEYFDKMLYDIEAPLFGAELTGPIVSKNAAERIAFAAVLVPGEPDLDYDKGEKLLTEAEVERVANQWLASYGNIDLQHSLNNVAVPVQSYTTYSDRVVKVGGQDLKLPRGTWILGSRLDEPTWAKVVDGTLTGYSVMGIRKAAMKSVLKGDEVLKKTLIKDLGEDWVAPFVSVVDTPAVPKSKWFVLKSVEPEPPKRWYQRLFAGAGEQPADVDDVAGAEKSGRRYSAATYERIKNILEMVKELAAEAEDERKQSDDVGLGFAAGLSRKEVEQVSQDFSEILKGVLERLDAISAAQKVADVADVADDFRAEVSKRLEQLEAGRHVASNALKGQDGAGVLVEVIEDDRDLYGRKRK